MAQVIYYGQSIWNHLFGGTESDRFLGFCTKLNPTMIVAHSSSDVAEILSCEMGINLSSYMHIIIAVPFGNVSVFVVEMGINISNNSKGFPTFVP